MQVNQLSWILRNVKGATRGDWTKINPLLVRVKKRWSVLLQIVWVELHQNIICNTINSHIHSQGRRQKNFQGGGGNEKTRPKNSTIKPFFTLLVPWMNIWGGHGPLALRYRHPCSQLVSNNFDFIRYNDLSLKRVSYRNAYEFPASQLGSQLGAQLA